MVKRLDNSNRFSGVGQTKTAGRTANAEQTSGVPGETLRFSREDFAAFKGDRNQVFLEALSPEEGLKKMKAIMEIRTAADFSMAFTDRVMKDPLLQELFITWYQAVHAGAGNAGTNQSAGKLASSEMVISRIEVETWMKTVTAALEKMVAAQKETPINIAAVGLEIIDRKAELLKLAPDPMALAPVLTAMAKLGGLDEPARRYFFNQLAQLAMTHVRATDQRKPEDLSKALGHLRTAIDGLIKNGEKKKVVDDMIKEAQRIGRARDGETGKAEQIHNMGLLLGTLDKGAANAEVELDKYRTELLDLIHTKQTEGTPLTTEELSSFKALLDVSVKSKKLFEQMPDVIDAITLHPKLRQPPVSDGTAPAQTSVYTPSAEEFQTFQALTAQFLKSLGTVYNGREGLTDGHKELCKQAQILVQKCLVATGDESANLAVLVQQMTRHPDLAMSASDIVSDVWISNITQRLDACRGLVISALENENIDAAKFHFDNRFGEDDGHNKIREAAIMAAAAELVNRKHGVLDGEEASVGWVAESHTQGIEAALPKPDVGGTPNFDAAKRILRVLSTDYDDWKLDARGSLNLVNQTLAQTSGWANFFDLYPPLVGLLARHADDEGCMEKAKSLIQTFIDQTKKLKGNVPFDCNGVQMNYRMDDAALEMMKVCAPHTKLAAFIPPLAEAYVAAQPMKESAAKYAEAVVTMNGPPGLKERLAYLVQDEQLKGVAQEHVARMALAWAASPETHHRARELITMFDKTHRPTEVGKLTADAQNAYVRMEGAVRLAVPNLMTEKTATDLFAGFKAVNKLVSQSTVEQVARYMPRDLVTKVLQNVDVAEAKEIIKLRNEGKTEAEADAATQAPAQT